VSRDHSERGFALGFCYVEKWFCTWSVLSSPGPTIFLRRKMPVEAVVGLNNLFTLILGLSNGFPRGWSKIPGAFCVCPSHITMGKLSKQEFSQLKLVL
jgi:hypothetical protein